MSCNGRFHIMPELLQKEACEHYNCRQCWHARITTSKSSRSIVRETHGEWVDTVNLTGLPVKGLIHLNIWNFGANMIIESSIKIQNDIIATIGDVSEVAMNWLLFCNHPWPLPNGKNPMIPRDWSCGFRTAALSNLNNWQVNQFSLAMSNMFEKKTGMTFT